MDPRLGTQTQTGVRAERPSHLEDACPVCQRETWKTVPVKIASKSQILRYKLNNQGGGRSLQWKLYGTDKRKVVLSSRVMGISVVRTSPAPEETRRLSARLSAPAHFSQNQNEQSSVPWDQNARAASGRAFRFPTGCAVGSRNPEQRGAGTRAEDRRRDPRDKTTRMCSINSRQRGQNIQGGNNRLFNKWSWENCTVTCRRMELDHDTTHERKLEMDKDLNGRPETIKLSEENIGG